MTHLADSVAIVTGGATGIGFAIAKRLTSEGAKVVIADSGVSIDGRNPDPSASRAAAKQLGGGTVGFSEHLDSPEAASRLIKQTKDQFGKIDILEFLKSNAYKHLMIIIIFMVHIKSNGVR